MSSSAASTPLEPTRVAIDVGPLYGHRTGVGVATAGIVDALAHRSDVELDPFLVSFRSKPHPGHRRLPIPGQLASHLWSRTSRPRVDRWAGRAAVVHGTNYVVPPTNLPTVVSVYDCWFLERPDLASATVRRAGKRLARAISDGAHVHTGSEYAATRVRDLFGTDRVTAIPLGAPPAPPPLAELGNPPATKLLKGRPFVVAIGTEERRKGLSLLVQAFAAVSSEQPGLVLVLAGAPGDDSATVDASVAALPADLAANVLRLGPIDDTTKHWLLRQASVVAYPSVDEGFGFPILEGQLAGTPVVASAAGSIPEIAGPGAVIVEGRDASDFAAGLASALDGGAHRLGLIEAGHRNVKRFSWTAAGDQLVQLYQQAIADT